VKRFFTVLAVFVLAFAGCTQPANEDNSGNKLPSLTIRNQSSYVLSNVTFSGISFATSGNDLPVSSQAVKQLTENDLNKTGYITFTRKDIGINCRTEAITITDQDYTFTFLDTSVVEEVGNSANKRALSQIAYMSNVVIERNGLPVSKNETLDLGKTLIDTSKQYDFVLRNSSNTGNLVFEGSVPIQITGSGASAFLVSQPASSEIAAGGSVPFTVTFNPAASIQYNAAITVYTSNNQGGNFVFNVSATGALTASSESRLDGLQFTSGKLDPQFHTDILTYTLSIDSGLSVVNVVPTSIDSNITSLTVNGVNRNSGVQSQDILLESTSTVTIVVTAENGTAASTYTVAINRILNYSRVDLSSLYVATMDNTYTEDVVSFLDMSNDTVYFDALPDETQFKFKITPLNSNAVIRLNNNIIAKGEFTSGHTLNPGDQDTEFTVTITAEDGINSQTFYLVFSLLGSQWEIVGSFPSSGSNALRWEPTGNVVVHNNQFVYTNVDEVFVSTDGVSWNRVSDFSDYGIAHYLSTSVVHNNTIFNVGGMRYNSATQEYDVDSVVSSSTNGLYWNRPTVTGLANGIMQHASVVFNGNIYAMGGETRTSAYTNAIHRSADGTSWSTVTVNGSQWGARAGHAAVVFNNQIYVIGGYYGNTEYRDVWRSSNGTSWTQVTSSAAWTGRSFHSVSVNSYGMWLVGGNDGYDRNDVWFSRDGSIWISVLQNAPFAGRILHSAVVVDGYLYIFGGVNEDFEPRYDIWKTYIGE